VTPDQITATIAAASFLPALLAVAKSGTDAGTSPGGPHTASIILAVLGPAYAIYSRSVGEGWHLDLSGALWASACATMLILAVATVMTREGWRLGVLAVPYAAALAVIAAIRDQTLGISGAVIAGGPTAWLAVHAALSIGTYAIATMGAVAATAGLIQQRALKHKTRTPLNRRLPSLADCDRLQTRFIALCAGLLGLGLASGVATSLVRDGAVLTLDHKTVFGFVAFAVLVVLLIADRRGNVRTRQLGRAVLAAYLLLTLAYIGVKVVTDVLL